MADTKEEMLKTFVGIDLSVFNIVVSSSNSNRPTGVDVAVNDLSNRATPAAVGLIDNERPIGDHAQSKANSCPTSVFTSLPAVLGTPEAARANLERFGCMWSVSDDGRIGPVAFGGKEDLLLQPASCLAALLQKMASYAIGDSVLDLSPSDAAEAQHFEVATSVPDSWGEAELATLRAAVDILGWRAEACHVLPYSAALATAYAARFSQKLNEGEERRVVAFVDVGFSQSSISIVAFTPAGEGAEVQDLGVEALSVCASQTVGTLNICSVLAAHIDKKFQAKGKDPINMASKRGARLTTALQKAVKELSMGPDTTVVIEVFFPDDSDLVFDITRAQFEDLIAGQMQELSALARRALDEAGVEAEAVHSVELVGGGMRIPKVQALFSELFPDAADAEMNDGDGSPDASGKAISRRLRFSLDGASAVATGAAHFAAGRRALAAKWVLKDQASALKDDAALAECRELEAWMATTHREEVRRQEKGDELERLVYEARNLLSGPDRALLKPEVTEPLVDKTFDWFEDNKFDPATTLAMYEEKLTALRSALEEHGAEYYAKKQREKEEKEKFLDAEAEKERQRRHDLGMDADKDDRKMAKSERLKMATKNKEEGNTVFKAGNLEDAAARYQRSIQHLNKFFMLDVSPDEKAEADAVFLSVHLNLAQVFLKLAAAKEKESKNDAEAFYQKAKTSTDEALKIDAESVKARFRKATALEKLGQLDDASKEVKTALKTDPENADMKKLKERLDKLQAAQNAKAKKMYGKMFG